MLGRKCFLFWSAKPTGSPAPLVTLLTLNPCPQTLLCAEGVEVGPSVLELAQQEYRLRAQPQLARTLASELDRRSSRASLTLSLSSPDAPSAPSTRPPSTCSFSTTACT